MPAQVKKTKNKDNEVPKTHKELKTPQKPATQQAPMPKKVSLADIKKGSMVGDIHPKTVEFIHNGEQMSVDILIKTLPFGITEDLFKRWDNKEDVVSEWISLALVDDNGDQQFTKEEVDDNFVQGMAAAVFDEVWGAINVKKKLELTMNQDLSLANMK